jgi:hypothetical protein
MRRLLNGFLDVASVGQFPRPLSRARSGGGPAAVEPVTVLDGLGHRSRGGGVRPGRPLRASRPSQPWAARVQRGKRACAGPLPGRDWCHGPRPRAAPTGSPPGQRAGAGYAARIPFAQLGTAAARSMPRGRTAPSPTAFRGICSTGSARTGVVDLCSPAGDVPVDVSCRATSALVVSGGELQPTPPNSGNEFRSAAVPHGYCADTGLPLGARGGGRVRVPRDGAPL